VHQTLKSKSEESESERDRWGPSWTNAEILGQIAKSL